MVRIGDTRLRGEPGIQSDGLADVGRHDLRRGLGAQLQQRHIDVLLGGVTYTGGQLAAMSDAQFNRLCGRAGLDSGDVLQLLDDVNLDANQGHTVNLAATGALARATSLADGIDGDYDTSRPSAPAPTRDAAGVLAPESRRLAAEHVEQPGWVMRSLLAIGDSVRELSTAGGARTWTYNDQPSAAQGAHFHQLGYELAERHLTQLAALLEQPGGQTDLLHYLQQLHPGEAGWQQAAADMLDGVEAATKTDRDALSELQRGVQHRGVRNQIGALYADYAGDDDRLANLEVVVQDLAHASIGAPVQLAVLRALGVAGCSDVAADVAAAALRLHPRARTAAADALRHIAPADLPAMASLVGRNDFARLPPRLQAGVIRAAAASAFQPQATTRLLTLAEDPNFAGLDAATQGRCFRLLDSARGDDSRTQRLVEIFTAAAFCSASATDRQRVLDDAAANIEDPAMLQRIRDALYVRAAAAPSDMRRAAQRFGISANRRAAIRIQLQARNISFVYRHGDTTYTIRPNGPNEPAKGQISLARILASPHPEAAVERELPGIDPHDFGSLLVGVAASGAFDEQIDISPGSRAAQRFALTDGVDGNALAGLEPSLTKVANLRNYAQRMTDRGIVFKYAHGHSYLTIDGVELGNVLQQADPVAAAAKRWPGLDFHNFERFLADMSTLPDDGEATDIVGGTINLSDEVDFRRANLFSKRPYNRYRAQRALRDWFYNDSLTFLRGHDVSGMLDAPPARATATASAAVQEDRIAVAATGATEYSYESGAGYYTRDLVALLSHTGKLGAALARSAIFQAPGETQMATLTGDPRLLDAVAPQHVHALLIYCSHFPEDPTLHGTFQDVRNMRRALSRSGPHGPGIPAANLTTLADPGHRQAIAAMASQIERAQPGDVVLVYASTHGDTDGFEMADGQDVDDDTITRLYNTAEARGVRLVLVEDTCHSGAQVEAVRRQEIHRLVVAGTAPPGLQDADALRAHLVGLRSNAADYVSLRSQVPANLRLISPGQLGRWLARGMPKRDGAGKWVAGDSLLTLLEADPQQAAVLARLDDRATAIERQSEAHDNDPTQPAVTDAEWNIVGYDKAVHDMSKELQATATAECNLLNGPSLDAAPRLQHLVEDPDLRGERQQISQQHLVTLIDRADDALTQLIVSANAAPAP